jgi:hypothetical protein
MQWLATSAADFKLVAVRCDVLDRVTAVCFGVEIHRVATANMMVDV